MKKEITTKTKLGEIFQSNNEETKRIIKQMEAYGMQAIGYGVNYGQTFGDHAISQSITPLQLKNLLISLNKRL